MPPIINFKICDNSADCNGISECPMGVFLWDEQNQTIKIENEKCIECGACASFCSVEAIRYAKDTNELAIIQKEIDDDTRTISDLFVERYGATLVHEMFCFNHEKDVFENRINSARPYIMEFNRPDTIECLLKSVHSADIQNEFHKDASYLKYITSDEEILAKYGVTTTPCLRFFYRGKLIGSIDGYFDKDTKYEYFESIKEFGLKIK